MEVVSFGLPYLSGYFLWSAYHEYGQKLVTLFEMIHNFLEAL